MAEYNFFQYLNSIYTKKKLPHSKECSGYMLVMWLSHFNEFLPILNELNKFIFDLNDRQIYLYLLNKIPRGKKFTKYVKKKKIKLLKEVEELKESYNLSSKEALLYENCCRRISENN